MMPINEVVVHWYCGCYAGPFHWHRDVYEGHECGEEFDTVESIEDWDAELCSATCPKCGFHLTQKFDAPWWRLI